MEFKSQRKTYFYPKYSQNMLMLRGLFFYEWTIVVIVLVIPLFIIGPLGLIFGACFAGLFYILFLRADGARRNLMNQLISVLAYARAENTVIKKERVDMDNEDLIEVKINNKKKNKSKKTSKKKKKHKTKNMQDYFPFKIIEDNFIEMENGNLFIFLRIQSNHLDFLSYSEIDAVMSELGKQFDRSVIKPNYFIQDSVFDIKGNIRNAKKALEKETDPFLRRLGSDVIDYMKTNQKRTAQKSAYLFVEVKQEALRTQTKEEIKNKIKSTFRDNLNVTETSRSELKQLLAIYANRIFSENLPDTEVEFQEEYSNNLLVKKKQTYEQIQLPGIYEFKDLIVPITMKFRPSDATIGSRLIKTYAVSSFLASTEDTNLLSKIASLQGVTTTIRTESLSLNKYRSGIKTDIRASNSSSGDEIDDLDIELDKESVKASYKRIKKTKQKMYYVSILFQLNANTKDEFSILEDKFLELCGEVNLQVDPLETFQRQAFDTVNPIGRNKLAAWIKQNIPSESLANLYPFEDSSLMDKTGLPLGKIVDKEDPVLFDPFTDRESNHNILILGYSGVGKTTLLWLLLMNEALQGSYIRNLDVEGNCIDFIQRLGGININMAGNNEYCINPLHIRIPDEIKSGIVDDYVSEVKNFMSIYKSSWSERLLDLFEHYVSKIYIKKGISNTTDLTKLKATDMPIFEDIYNLIKEDKNNFDATKMLGTVQDLSDLLLGMESMVHGADAKLFNRYTYLGESNDVRIINFDLSDMMNSSLDRKLAQWSNVFTYISQFVNKNMDRSKKIVVAVDEMHTFLKKQYMSILEIIDSYERRFRKYLASFIKASQTIEEFNRDDDDLKDKVKTLFSQSGVKFIFHLGDIDYKVTKELLNLKELEIKTLKEKRQGKCLMRVNDNIFDLDVMMPEWFSEVKKDTKDYGAS